MGFPWFRNRITKTRESICCFKIKGRIDLKFLLLNDGRIILYNEETIKIYRILNNSISLELKFNLDYGKGKKGPYIIYEIEKNIILIGSSDLILIDLKRNLKILQKININNTSKNYNILKLSNGLIAIYFSEGIKIFDYDKKEKKIIKKYEIDIPYLSVKELYEINSENIIIYSNSDSFVYILNLKTKKIKNMEINTNKKYFYRKSLLIENFYVIFYLINTDEKYIGYLDIFKIDLEEIKLLQTINLNYPYIIKQLIRLNENKLIGNDIKGNIYEFNIADNFHISLKDIFKGCDKDDDRINIYKYNYNKIIAINVIDIKIWEFE